MTGNSSSIKQGIDKAKTSFSNLKPGAKAGVVVGVVGLALIGVGNSQNPSTAVNSVPATPIVSEEELSDALDKCTLLKASESYKTNSKITETELFQKAENACETKKADYENRLDEYVKDIKEEWNKNNSNLIVDKPLTYYLKEATEEEERVTAFAKPLQAINKQKAEAEAKKKAEAEAEAAAAAAAQRRSAQSQNNQATTESSNLPLKATCKDGTTSYQDDPSGTTYRGMCSHHGGIAAKHGRAP